MADDEASGKAQGNLRRRILAGSTVFAALVATGLLAVSYSPLGSSGNGAACAVDAATVSAVRAGAVGEVAAFQAAAKPAAMPELRFLKPDGTPTTLAEMKGRTLLVNLWATWCAPCRKEMPALDALQKEFGGERFEVVAVNIDTRNLDKPRAWLAKNGVDALAYYSDPEAKVFQELKRTGQAVGMPTTLLVDRAGCGLGVLHGAAEWHSADAKRLIQAAVPR